MWFAETGIRWSEGTAFPETGEREKFSDPICHRDDMKPAAILRYGSDPVFLLAWVAVRGKGTKNTVRKILEATGCLLYLVAIVVLIAVFLSHCGGIFD